MGLLAPKTGADKNAEEFFNKLAVYRRATGRCNIEA
jgi:hypothetical protein